MTIKRHYIIEMLSDTQTCGISHKRVLSVFFAALFAIFCFLDSVQKVPFHASDMVLGLLFGAFTGMSSLSVGERFSGSRVNNLQKSNENG